MNNCKCPDCIKEELFDNLMEKVTDEMNQFINSIQTKSGKEIIQEMIPYELIYKEDILMCLEDDELVLSYEKIDFLLRLDKPLDWLYHKWLKSDDSHMKMLRGFINSTLDRVVEDQ